MRIFPMEAMTDSELYWIKIAHREAETKGDQTLANALDRIVRKFQPVEHKE